jgi:hemoglobin/transferrin/lactoferrin receptor protein
MSWSPNLRGRSGLPAALLALGAVLATAAVARAAEKAATPPDTTKPVMFLKETLVTGSRYPRAYYESPQALSFVTRTQLRQQQPTVVGDVLYGVPGVDNSKDSPWEQRPVVRGLSGQRVLVMMDGSPMNSARGNGPHPSLVDQSQVERIEVVRGPSSVAYGSDALGGVINIITRQAPLEGPDRSLKGSAIIGGSSVDQQRNGYLELIPRIGKLSAFLSAGARKTEDFETPDHGKVLNSAFSDYNAMANVRYAFTGRTALKAGWQLYRGHDIGIPGLTVSVPGFSQDFQFPYYNRNAVHLTAEHTHDASSWFASSSAKVYWQSEDRDFFSHMNIDFTGAPGFPPGPVTFKQSTDRYFQLDTYGLRVQADSRKFDAYSLSFGIDAARDKTAGTNVAVNRFVDGSESDIFPPSTTVSQSLPKGDFDNLAGFAQSAIYLDPQWTLSAGARYTYYHYRTEAGVARPAGGGGGPPTPEVDFPPYRSDDGALAGSVGLVFALRPDLHMSANLANGYRQPNAQDLFFNGPASVGIVQGNQYLNPEKSVSTDYGLRWGPGDLAFSGNLFYSTYDDLIDAVETVAGTGGAPNTYQYVNITKARIWGGEAEAEWRFRRQWNARATCTGAVGDITSRGAIQTLYGVDQETAPLPNVPPFKGNATLRWTSKDGRLWVEPALRYSWRTNRLPLPTPGVPQIGAFKKEYMVGDLMAGYRFGGQRVQVGVRNFTDTAYQLPLASLEEPRISFIGSISADF